MYSEGNGRRGKKEDECGVSRLHFPKKRLGQHFLKDKNIIRKIVSAGAVKEGDTVLEIGPGRGALTGALLETGATVVAVEADRALSGYLKGVFTTDKLRLVTGDALKVSFAEFSGGIGTRLKAVSNLPYNISGPLLAKFLEERAAFSVLVLMFQKEVAERIVAHPSTKEYGTLSVYAQAFTEAKIAFNIPAHLFTPPPKVTSSVVVFKVLDEPKVEIADERLFKAVVRASFGTRRKTLLNSLVFLGYEKAVVAEALFHAGIDPGRRGETLSIDEFAALTRAFFALTAQSGDIP
ncbi:MAG: ribosomal RNA small subunit methyltransferase A [Deltaproteobacteria bacterium GWC2_56_8]|nr:MAG: ribosomal RNA small subunit methyltransferase A [Deltaproteobacteria bacterium GWB2_55_19]OGP37632.1 MAG: ribosomal RNA small subunit methyltransferase A [Deltaproteobacteria bacterium GWC2_56_8]